MNLGFVTCVKLGLSCMESIYKAGGSLSLVITLPDNISKEKSGRVYVDEFCANHNIQLLKSNNINNFDVVENIYKNNIDWLFIVGWSQIASTNILKSTNKGIIGMHPTLLPEGRGRASIPWAILKNLDKTGVTMFKMESGIDTGPIMAQMEIPLTKNVSATELYNQIANTHSAIIQSTINNIIDDNICLTPQDETKATIWPGRKPKDGEINLKGSVYDAERLVRAVTHPYPGAFFYLDGKKHIVWSAEILNEKDSKKDLNQIAHLKFDDGILLI